MSTHQGERFWEWAEAELRKRGLTWYGVERQAGLSNAAISKRAREWRVPTFNICRAIAQVFNLPIEMVLRQAGLLPSIPEDDLTLKELNELVGQMSPEGRREVLEYALFRYRREQERRERGASGRSAAASGGAKATGQAR